MDRGPGRVATTARTRSRPSRAPNLPHHRSPDATSGGHPPTARASSAPTASRRPAIAAARFAVTFDYLCPFARNANEHVIAALEAGADWDVTFTPYSLAQGHVDEGGTPVWERPDPTSASGVLALAVGVAVRDHLPERFLDAHVALFAARHDRGEDIKDPDVLRKALDSADVDADRVLDLVATGAPLETVRAEHERNVTEHGVWGVPTFVGSERSVFVRLLDRPEGDADRARGHIDRIVDLVDGWPELHEFKQTDLPV